MPIPFSPLLVLSACNALIRYQTRVDNILSISEVTQALPFGLPPRRTDDIYKLRQMLDFFETAEGKRILELHGLQADFDLFKPQAASIDLRPVVLRRLKYYEIYDDAKQIERSRTLSPDPNQQMDDDEALAYYIIGSKRISRYPPLVNLLLATTDVVLEVAGPNITLLMKNPGFGRILGTLLTEFAVRSDLEEEGGRAIVKNLLASTVRAITGDVGNADVSPSLKILFGTLGRIRESLGVEGDSLVETMLSAEGLRHLIAALAAEAAGIVPSIVDHRYTSDLLSAALSEVGRNFPAFKTDREALLGILRIGIGVTTSTGSTVVTRRLGGGRPLLSAVLTSILREVGETGRRDPLFAEIAGGEMLSNLYQVALGAIAANPLRFAGDDEIEKFTSELVAGLAKTFSEQRLSSLMSTKSLRLVAQDSLFILSENPELIAKDSRFATSFLASVFKAGSTAVGDGLSSGDLLDIVRVAVGAAAANANLINADQRWLAVLESAGEVIAATDLTGLLDRRQRRDLVRDVVRAIACNPGFWGQLQEKDLARALIGVIVAGLSERNGSILTGPAFVDATMRLLQACMTRGQLLIDEKVPLSSLRMMLTTALDCARAAPDQLAGAPILSRYLEQMAVAFLDSFSEIADDPQAFVIRMTPLIVADLTDLTLDDDRG